VLSEKEIERRVANLQPFALPTELVSVAGLLHEEACCGSRAHWGASILESLPTTPEGRSQFIASVHQGMWIAQERFLQRIADLGSHAMPKAELVLYRNAMDTIAWQMLQGQLCFVRQLYRGHRQPNLLASNLGSVIAVARQLRRDVPDSMPLIADLTQFVQIGDILMMDPSSGLSIIEVKEGKKNQDISELAGFYQSSKCEAFKSHVSQSVSEGTFKQFERMIRQIDRMDFATNLMGKGNAVDPDTSAKIEIPAPIFPVKDWVSELNATCDNAYEKGWAINVIDGTVFVGCYTGKETIHMSPYLFRVWLDQCVGTESPPIARMIDCVVNPVALPIFALPIAKERMMDILFGRLHICLGISIEGLVEECKKHGIIARAPNKKERRMISNGKSSTIKFRGQPLVLQRGDRSLVTSSGLFDRWMFHFQRPIALLNVMFDNVVTAAEKSSPDRE
jgi:hypothetical protein